MISFPPIFSDKNPFSYANLRVALRQVRDRAGAAQLALLAVHFFNFVLKHTLRFYAKKKIPPPQSVSFRFGTLK